MPKFRVQFVRTVHDTEWVTREIEAPTKEAAKAAAVKIAAAFDETWPEDARNGAGDADPWEAFSIDLD